MASDATCDRVYIPPTLVGDEHVVDGDHDLVRDTYGRVARHRLPRLASLVA